MCFREVEEFIDSSQGDSTYSDLFDDELYYNLANFIL